MKHRAVMTIGEMLENAAEDSGEVIAESVAQAVLNACLSDPTTTKATHDYESTNGLAFHLMVPSEADSRFLGFPENAGFIIVTHDSSRYEALGGVMYEDEWDATYAFGEQAWIGE